MSNLRGEVANVFRFGTVVFPLLFFLGDRCARRPVWFQGAMLVALLALNLATARGYAVGQWASWPWTTGESHAGEVRARKPSRARPSTA